MEYSRCWSRALVLSVAFASMASAQNALTVTGRVTSDAGQPIAGATVAIPELNAGALTQVDGRYSFGIAAARVTGQRVAITARRLGFQPQSDTVALTGTTLTKDFTLTATVAQLEGVVITGLGGEREKSQLGTAVQQVTAEELTRTREQNIMNQLSGKVAGLTVTGAGTQGGSTKVTIRGANSITGSNDPLFIVDGVAVSNATRGGSPNGGSLNNGTGFDFGSAINDINSEDVESITVLKGPNAAALYGSRASNGVVVITTKKGRASGGRIVTEASLGTSWERPSILPKFQNLYGQGAAGAFQYVDGAGGGVNDGADQSWGPRLNGQPIDQFTGTAQPWVAHPDNVESFFDTGNSLTGSLAFSGGTERASARLSLGAENTGGYIPNNFFRRFTGGLNGGLEVTDRLTTNASLSYIKNEGLNRPGVGYNTGILEQFIWFGRQVDMEALRDYHDEEGSQRNWNYNFHNNPFWLQFENPERDQRDRFIGTISANYRLAEGITATFRTGSDIYRFDVDQNFGPGNLNFSDPSYAGAFALLSDFRNENNTDLLVSGTRDITSGLTVNATIGGNQRREFFSRKTQNTPGISVPGIYNVSNAAITPTLGQSETRRQVNGAYGSLALTWKGWWTVEGTARNDWSSTLPDGENSYFYPSVNTSIVLTDAFPRFRSSVLSFLKVRGAIARVGADVDPYQLRTTYTGQSNKFGSMPQFTLSNTIANANLKPEITRSGEVGLELGMFDGRATLEASMYDKVTKNQFIFLTVSPASGFTSTAINAGQVRNKGFEASAAVTPLRTAGGFEWTSMFNFARNRGRVEELAPELSTIVIGSSWNANIEARKNERWGTIYGTPLKRDSATGQLLLLDGMPQAGPRSVLGHVEPDWVGGWSNSLSYKWIRVSALVDIRSGGELFSVSNMFGNYSGVFEESLRGREVDWDDPGLVLPGIDEATGQPNDTRVTAEAYWQGLFQLHEPFIYDGGYIKLRELRVEFDLPERWLRRLNSDRIGIGFFGRNLFTRTDVPHIDPEFTYSNGNFQGMEFAPLPNARSLGIVVRATR